MKSIFRMSIAATALLGAAMFTGAPAQARTDFSISIGVPGAVGFDYNSGGYCDSYGCPDGYWDYPVWYGPVFYHGRWYRGPVYYRDDLSDRRVYWIAGGWHHDQWRGPRPDWWDRGRYYSGPALGYSFYTGHGFRHDRDRYWRGNDWRGNDWHNDRHDRGWNDGRDHDRNDHDGNGASMNFNFNDHHDRDNHDHHDGDNYGRDNHTGDNHTGDNHDHDHHDHGDRDRHDRGMVTTTMSPAAAFAGATGPHGAAGHGPTPPPATGNNGASGGGSGASGSSDDDHHHHHH